MEKEIASLERCLLDKERELEDWQIKIKLKTDIIRKRSASQKASYSYNPRDPIDVAVGDAVNKNDFTVPVQRLGPGLYIFGTRNIKVVEGDRAN